MAVNITLLPGMGGEVGTLVQTSVQLLEDSAACVGTEGGDLISCFAAIIDLAELVYEIYEDFFPTRPKVGKDSATDDTALFFIPAANPVIALWGIGIRQLEMLGIPTSTGAGPGYQAQLNLANAVLADLKRQFDIAGAKGLLVNGVQITGALMFEWYHFLGFELPNPDSNRVAINNRVLLDAQYTALVALGFLDPVTGFPPVVKPVPPANPCPAGEHWDATLQMCVPDPVPLPVAPGDNDELGICCNETQIALAALLAAIQALGQGGNNDQCCIAITAALGAVVTQLARLVIELPALGVAIASLKDNIPIPFPVDLVEVAPALLAVLEGIRAAIAAAPGPAADLNVKRIADTLNGFPPDGPEIQAKLNSLIDVAVKTYGFPADLAQILTS